MRPAQAERLSHVGEYYFSQKLEALRRLAAEGRDVINLGIGSPDLAPSPAAIAAAQASLHSPKSHGYASYRSTIELRQAMTDWYGRVYGVALDPQSEALPLLGSKEGILYLSMAFLNPGDQVLVPNPGYPAYAAVASLIGAQAVFYDLKEEAGWLPDFASLEALDLSRCKLMWVNYPHMPTGQVAKPEFFRQLAAFAKRKGILACNDNPYGLILNQGAPLSLLALDPKMESCAELNSLSKSFNMAGWRVGMLMASARVVNAALQVKSNVDSGMFLPIQAGAAEALKNPDSWHAERNRIYLQRRECAWRLFDALDFRYDRAQQGLFAWAKAPESIASVERWVDELLEGASVFLAPGRIFGSNGARYARASLCAPAERIEQAIERAREFRARRGSP
jgi:aspartate/methionine/tyrosine aminotransferase